jgi:anaerobic dimethyl sulfoxide reductase subunit B (iron-sulfur subunit)
MGKQLGFYLDLDRCVQCHACEVACKSHNEVESGIMWRQVVGIWIGHYPDLIQRTISFSCMHCGEPSCIDACPTEAITKRPEDGIVVVDQDKCNGCEACAEACPFGVIHFGQDGIMQKCDLCLDRLALGKQPACIETCPSEALRFGTLEELSRQTSAQQLAGPTEPSMLISSERQSVLEPFLPWK